MNSKKMHIFIMLFALGKASALVVLKDGVRHQYHPVAQRAGVLDTTFGSNRNGLTFTRASSVYRGVITAIIQQASGKIVVVGSVITKVAGNNKILPFVARYNTQGELDTSFGDRGVTITDVSSDLVYCSCMIQQADRKIVIAGWVTDNILTGPITDNFARGRFFVARYTEDGHLDTNFGDRGISIKRETFNGMEDTQDADDFEVGDRIYAIIQQASGKIVVAGSIGDTNRKRYFALARYTILGELDDTFGPNGNGVVITNASALNGNDDGNDQVNAMIQQASGKIVVAGYSQNANLNRDFTLARYTEDGVLDDTFGPNNNGVVITNASALNGNDDGNDQINAMIQQASGKIVVAGYSENANFNRDFTLARYTEDGELDDTFGPNNNGVVITNASASNGNNNGSDKISAMIRQADGKIVVAGTSENANFNRDFTLARYTEDGVLDDTFGPVGPNRNGVVITNASALNGNATGNDEIYAMIRQADNEIVVAGYSVSANGNSQDLTLARYTEDGVLDDTFGPNRNGVVITNASALNGSAIGNDEINAMIQQPDGKIVVAGLGWSTDFVTEGAFVLARYNSQSTNFLELSATLFVNRGGGGGLVA